MRWLGRAAAVPLIADASSARASAHAMAGSWDAAGGEHGGLLAGFGPACWLRAGDVGGGFPPAPDERVYAQKLGGALGAVGFEGRLIVEPGRAVVGEAVDLACTVLAVKRLADGARCVVVDAGRDLVAGALFRWPHLDFVGAKREPAQSALVIGPRTKHLDVLHPAARLPPVQQGGVLLIRRVGAYNQSESTQLAEARAAVVARDNGRARVCGLPGSSARRRAWAQSVACDRGVEVVRERLSRAGARVELQAGVVAGADGS